MTVTHIELLPQDEETKEVIEAFKILQCDISYFECDYSFNVKVFHANNGEIYYEDISVIWILSKGENGFPKPVETWVCNNNLVFSFEDLPNKNVKVFKFNNKLKVVIE